MAVSATQLNAWLEALQALTRRPDIVGLDAIDIRNQHTELENCGPADVHELALVLSVLDDIKFSVKRTSDEGYAALDALCDEMYHAIYGQTPTQRDYA